MKIKQRKSIRLSGYDYSQEGLYFITICTAHRKNIFGEIHNGIMSPNNIAEIADKCWFEIPQHFPETILHEFCIMPNHIHGIIELVGANQHSPTNKANQHSPKILKQNTIFETLHNKLNISNETIYIENQQSSNIEIKNNDLQNICTQNINSQTANIGITNNMANVNSPCIRANVDSPLRGPSLTIGSIIRGYKIGVTKWVRNNTTIYDVWQRNYYENIIRNEQSYFRISEYIKNNPAMWEKDSLK
jgi:putative transposase